MDPYLEDTNLWPDVHNSLINTIRDQIQVAIVPRYRAVITPYVTFESIEVAPVRMVVPDVAVVEKNPLVESSSTAVTIAPPPLTLPTVMEVPTEYARIEIRTLRDQVLVTVIELLSPANKRPGVDGAEAYHKKRQELLHSTANILEIDLLRGGKRPQVARTLPDAPYFIFLSRAQRRSFVDIWPLSLREAMVPVPVPLLPPDPDVPLDLGQAIHDVYRRARYDLEIDYRQTPPLPALFDDDAVWLDTHLRECGLRPVDNLPNA